MVVVRDIAVSSELDIVQDSEVREEVVEDVSSLDR